MIDYNALAQAIDTTWGRSSTPLTASNSIKFQLVGEGSLKVMYSAVVNFRSNQEYIRMKKSYKEDAQRIVDVALKRMKDLYKEQTGGSLKTSLVASDDSLEIIGLGIYNPKRTAYFRWTCLYEID